ncbi:MAG: S-methyl-5-thioribose-1-phosphate isomerase [Candidatus Asgardarchaeum sp.]
MLQPIKWENNSLILIDQNKLPNEMVEIVCTDYYCVAEAIKTMKVRGAPAIGVAAAFGIVLAVLKSKATTVDGILLDAMEAAKTLKETRPTAVNLFWAIDRMLNELRKGKNIAEIKEIAIKEALKIMEEDIETNKKIGAYGATLIEDGDGILTHCNAGALATAGYGTALGVIRAAIEQGKRIHVYADETRPKLQGARLTAFELHYDNIPVTVITDNMAAYCMNKGMISKVFTAADRIAMDGTVANKVGTFQLALAAQYHKLPFYVLGYGGPDRRCLKAEDIPIEIRDPEEVLVFKGERTTGEKVQGFYPAFDLTPAGLVKGIITDRGIFDPSDFGKYWSE